jgi:hypothetical protein
MSFWVQAYKLGSEKGECIENKKVRDKDGDVLETEKGVLISENNK